MPTMELRGAPWKAGRGSGIWTLWSSRPARSTRRARDSAGSALAVDQPDLVPFHRVEDLVGGSEAHRLADICGNPQVIEPGLPTGEQDHSTGNGSRRVGVVERQAGLQLGPRFDVHERPALGVSAEQPPVDDVPGEQRSGHRRGRGRPGPGRGRTAPRRGRLLLALTGRRRPVVVAEQHPSRQKAHDDGPHDQTDTAPTPRAPGPTGRHLLQGADLPRRTEHLDRRKLFVGRRRPTDSAPRLEPHGPGIGPVRTCRHRHARSSPSAP